MSRRVIQADHSEWTCPACGNVLDGCSDPLDSPPTCAARAGCTEMTEIVLAVGAWFMVDDLGGYLDGPYESEALATADLPDMDNSRSGVTP